MYEGLPTTTNKIPLKERNGIPHHLLGCVKLEEEPWTVRQFYDGASKIIEEIRSRGKLPVLVGGTHYYTQSLLFDRTLVEDDDHLEHVLEEELEKWPILGSNTSEMLEELQTVDPEMAQQWHPNDRRKIRRSLQIWLQTGKKASDVYRKQRQGSPGNEADGFEHSMKNLGNPERAENRGSLGNPSNYHPLVFWTYSASDVLNERLDQRVESMVFNGLFEEAQSMHTFLQTQAQQGHIIDDTRGIWIAIGFKEILPYVTSQFRTKEERKEGIERTKVATRQYAKRQNRWIRLKLLHAMQEAGLEANMFLLDATDISQYPTNVEAVAGNLASTFLTGNELPKPATLSDVAKELLVTTEKESKSARHCEACDKTMMSEPEWLNHLKSKGHRYAIRPVVNWRALYPKNEKN